MGRRRLLKKTWSGGEVLPKRSGLFMIDLLANGFLAWFITYTLDEVRFLRLLEEREVGHDTGRLVAIPSAG